MAPRVSPNHRLETVVTAPKAFGATIHLDKVAVFCYNATKKMESTRFFVEDDIKALDIYDEIVRLFGNIGWAFFFMSHGTPTGGPILEMLMMLKLDSSKHDGPQGVAFCGGGTEYNLSTFDINKAFDAPFTGVYLKHDDFIANTIWPLIVEPDTPHFATQRH